MWRIWAAALFWGLNWPFIKILLTGATPWTLRAAGFVASTSLVGLLTLASGQSLRVPRALWGRLAVAGLLNVAGFSLLTVFAQMTMTASRSAILTYTMPLWSVIFARLLLGERIDMVRWLALAGGAIGIALLAHPFWPQLSRGDVPAGLAFVLGAAIVWAAGTVYLKWVDLGLPPMVSTTWQMATGAVVSIIGMLLFEMGPDVVGRLELGRPEILGTFILHVLFPQAAAYVLWFGLMARVPASTAALGTLLVPVFALAGSIILVNERPTILDLTGFAAILGAVVADQLWRRRNG